MAGLITLHKKRGIRKQLVFLLYHDSFWTDTYNKKNFLGLLWTLRLSDPVALFKPVLRVVPVYLLTVKIKLMGKSLNWQKLLSHHHVKTT